MGLKPRRDFPVPVTMLAGLQTTDNERAAMPQDTAGHHVSSFSLQMRSDLFVPDLSRGTATVQQQQPPEKSAEYLPPSFPRRQKSSLPLPSTRLFRVAIKY